VERHSQSPRTDGGLAPEPTADGAVRAPEVRARADRDQLKLTLTGGESLEAKRSLIVATEPVDLGRPGQFCDSCATTGESLTEGNDQGRIGDTRETGESVRLRGTGTGELEGVTVLLVWNPLAATGGTEVRFPERGPPVRVDGPRRCFARHPEVCVRTSASGFRRRSGEVDVERPSAPVPVRGIRLTVYVSRPKDVDVSSNQSTAFLSASAVVALLGCLLVTVTPIVAGASRAFLGSIVTSGLLGVVFAAQNLWLYRVRSVPSVPAATLTTVFGVWFMAAPLLYDVGFLATAGTQFGGLLVAAFALYMLVTALSTSR